MIFWAVIATFVAIPAYLHWRGWGIVAISAYTAGLYGLGVLIWFVLTKAPPKVVAFLLSALETVSPPTDLTYHDTYYVFAQFEAAALPMSIFATIAAVFWLLTKWRAPIFERTLKVLFWLLHGALLAPFITARAILHQGMPRRFIDGEDLSGYFAVTGLFEFLMAIALMGFTAAAAWSVFRKFNV